MQVIDRVHPPTLQYVGVAAWWTDVFRMHDYIVRTQRRPRETRDAAYFNKAMFDPFASFADHVASGECRRLANRLQTAGIPDLY